MESGLDKVEEYGRPFVEKYGRTALAVGVAALAALGVVAIVARRRRHRSLSMRLQQALPDSVSSRLEKPLVSIKAAADRIAR